MEVAVVVVCDGQKLLRLASSLSKLRKKKRGKGVN